MGQKLEASGETRLLSKSQRTVWLTLVLGHCKKRDCDMQPPAVPPVKGLLDPAKHASCSNSSYTALWTMACSLPCERCSLHRGYFCHFGDKKWSNNIACMPYCHLQAYLYFAFTVLCPKNFIECLLSRPIAMANLNFVFSFLLYFYY